MASLIISRRNFGLGLIAHVTAACDRVENYAIQNKFAEKNVPAIGTILNVNGLRAHGYVCLLYTSPSPRDGLLSRMPSSA